MLAPLEITAAASKMDAGIQKIMHVSGTTTLIISNEEMNGIWKIVQALEDSNILFKGVTKTNKNETKEQKGGVLGMLLGNLEASLLGNMLIRKGMLRAAYGNKKEKECQELVLDLNGILMPPHPLINFEIQKYYQNKPRLNGVYFRYNLPKRIKDGAYANLGEYADVGSHWIGLYCKDIEVIYFDSFEVEHVPKDS